MKAIFTIIADIFWFVMRFLKRKDSPTNQYEQAKSDNAKAVISGDANAVNASLDRSIDRLRDDQAGSGNP